MQDKLPQIKIIGQLAPMAPQKWIPNGPQTDPKWALDKSQMGPSRSQTGSEQAPNWPRTGGCVLLQPEGPIKRRIPALHSAVTATTGDFFESIVAAEDHELHAMLDSICFSMAGRPLTGRLLRKSLATSYEKPNTFTSCSTAWSAWAIVASSSVDVVAAEAAANGGDPSWSAILR